jgi:DNA repair protein RecO (recombination protein O)
MNETIHALILDRKDYKEADALLTVLCQTHGVMTWIAKGANKPTSKYSSLLQPLYQINALVDVKKGISLFKSASIVKTHRHISQDLELLAVASFLLKIIAINAQDDSFLFDYEKIMTYLDMMTSHNRYAIGTHFLMKIASDMGLTMEYDRCVICHHTSIAALSISAGGFVCPTCQQDVRHDVFNIEFYRHLRCLSKASMMQIEQCGEGFVIEHMRVYVELLDETIHIPKKNWQFLVQI